MTAASQSGPIPSRAPVVIVGAGLAGAATAWYLARRGIKALVLERREAPGLESSGRSAAMLREHAEDPRLQGLGSRAMAFHRRAELASFWPNGSLLASSGLTDEPVSRRVPVASGRGRFFPGDGLVEVRALLRAFLRDADVRTGALVTSLEAGSEGLRVAVTLDGMRHVIETPVVVNAAGAWAGALGSLPLEPRKRHLFRLGGGPVDPRWPFTWYLDEGLYFRPDGETLLASPCDESPAEPGDDRTDPAARALLDAKIRKLAPGLASHRVLAEHAGQRTFAPDKLPVVGWDPRLRGLLWVAGLGGSGVTLAPAVGELAATLAQAGPDATPTRESALLSPARLLPRAR